MATGLFVWIIHCTCPLATSGRLWDRIRPFLVYPFHLIFINDFGESNSEAVCEWFDLVRCWELLICLNLNFGSFFFYLYKDFKIYILGHQLLILFIISIVLYLFYIRLKDFSHHRFVFKYFTIIFLLKYF